MKVFFRGGGRRKMVVEIDRKYSLKTFEKVLEIFWRIFSDGILCVFFGVVGFFSNYNKKINYIFFGGSHPKTIGKYNKEIIICVSLYYLLCTLLVTFLYLLCTFILKIYYLHNFIFSSGQLFVKSLI